ncbi:MAG: putative transporter [Desulfovibrio sp.]|nr:putative transporter [Desulfovibrio sp.]
MEFFSKLFFEHGAVQTVLVISITIVLGILLGKIRIAGVRFGIGGILFSGILLGHFGFSLDPGILHFVREFGLILFVFAVGMQVGPFFVESLRDQGLKLNLMAIFIVLSGTLMAAVLYMLFGLSIPQTAGIFAGAVTNTPAMGSASEAWDLVSGSAESAADGLRAITMAYAVCYPFGIFGIIITMMLIKRLFHINMDQELANVAEQQRNKYPPLFDRTIVVGNTALRGTKICELPGQGRDYVVVYVHTKGTSIIPLTDDLLLEPGMRLHVWGAESNLEKLAKLLVAEGTENSSTGPDSLSTRTFLISTTEVLGTSLHNLRVKLAKEHGIAIASATRSGIESLPFANLKLRLGDRVTVVGTENALKAAQKIFGNSPRALGKAQVLPLFLGIFLGTLVGSLPIDVPALPTDVKIGVAGGSLILGIILSRIHHFCGLTWYMSTGANLLMREMGILLFLGCVGLFAGKDFIYSVLNGGLLWMGIGALITFLPIFLAALLCRVLWHIDYPAICGLLAGSMTDPPALAFSMQYLSTNLPASSYATVYPLTMILRILAGQLLIILLFGAG